MKKTIIALAVLSVYIMLDGLSDAFMFRDYCASLSNNQIWHAWQLARQALIIGFLAYYLRSWAFILLGASFFWMLHDGILNRIAFDLPFFYVGTTAMIDRFFQLFKNPELVIGITKSLFVTGSIFLWAYKK